MKREEDGLFEVNLEFGLISIPGKKDRECLYKQWRINFYKINFNLKKNGIKMNGNTQM